MLGGFDFVWWQLSLSCCLRLNGMRFESGCVKVVVGGLWVDCFCVMFGFFFCLCVFVLGGWAFFFCLFMVEG